jgi:hypothetical protein
METDCCIIATRFILDGEEIRIIATLPTGFPALRRYETRRSCLTSQPLPKRPLPRHGAKIAPAPDFYPQMPE